MTRTRRTLIARTSGDPGVAVGPALLALDALFPDLPRNRVVRDESLLEIAARKPATVDDLSVLRG